MTVNRELIYRVCYSCTDSFGVINKSQGELAELLGMSYQQFSKVFKEFTEMGMLRKDKHKFTVLYHPDKIPWGDKYMSLRAKYIEKHGAINATKSERTSREDRPDFY